MAKPPKKPSKPGAMRVNEISSSGMAPGGFVGSHRIPESVLNNTGFDSLLVLSNGTLAWDRGLAIHNGQPLPGYRASTADAAGFARHAGNHQLLTNNIENYLRTWSGQLRTALQNETNTALHDGIKRDYARRAQNLSDAVAALSADGFADGSNRLLYTTTDPRAANLIPNWAGMSIDAKRDALRTYNNALLSSAVDANGNFVGSAAHRMKALKDITGGAVWLTKPGYNDIAQRIANYAADPNNNIDLTTRHAADIWDEMPAALKAGAHPAAEAAFKAARSAGVPISWVKILAVGGGEFLVRLSPVGDVADAAEVGVIVYRYSQGHLSFEPNPLKNKNPYDAWSDATRWIGNGGADVYRPLGNIPGSPGPGASKQEAYNYVTAYLNRHFSIPSTHEVFLLGSPSQGWSYGVDDKRMAGQAHDTTLLFWSPPANYSGPPKKPVILRQISGKYVVDDLEHGKTHVFDSKTDYDLYLRALNGDQEARNQVSLNAPSGAIISIANNGEAKPPEQIAKEAGEQLQFITGLVDGSAAGGSTVLQRRNFWSTWAGVLADGAVATWKFLTAPQGEASASSFGYAFGSHLGRALAKDDAALGVVSGALIGVVAMNLGQMWTTRPVQTTGWNGSTSPLAEGKSVWADFTPEFAQYAAGAAVGAISSYFAAEISEKLGLEGDVGAFVQQGIGGVIGHALGNFSGWGTSTFQGILEGGTLNQSFKNLLNAFKWENTTAVNPMVGRPVTVTTGLKDLSLSVVTSFFASKLASSIVKAETQAGAILGSLGSSIGSMFAGPIGSFVGQVIGTFIGNLFGRKKPRVPTASAETVLQIPLARYELGAVSQSNAGNLDLVRSMGMAARDTLNGLIDTVTRGDEYAKADNISSPTQVYGHTGGQLWVKLGGVSAQAHHVASADEAIDMGVLYALPATQIVGGDLFLKRALHHEIRAKASNDDRIEASANVAALLGNLSIAAQYSEYIAYKRPFVDALIAEPYASMKLATVDYLAFVRSELLVEYKVEHAAGSIDADPDAKNLAQVRIWGATRWAALNDAQKEALLAAHANWSVPANSDSDFYDTHKAKVSRIIAHMSGVDLAADDLMFYNANRSQVDRLVSRIALTQMAATWIITLQRAAELELDRTAVSDFYGGAKGFVDSLGLSVAGAPLDYESVSFNLIGADLRIGYAPFDVGASANLVRGGDLSEGVAPASAPWTAGGVAYQLRVETLDDASALTARKNTGEIPPWSSYAWGGDVIIGGGDCAGGGHTVTPGETVGFALEAKKLAAGLSVIGVVAFWDAAGNWLSHSTDAWVNGDGWVRLTGTAVAPTGAAYATVRAFSLRADGNVAGAFDFGLRNVQLHRLPAGGSVPDWSGAPYETWVESNFLADADYSTTWAASERARDNYFNWTTLETPAHYDDLWNGVEGGDDIATGTMYADYFNGRSGDDWLNGRAADDTIDGGDGNDVLLGDKGDDWLAGGAGNDYLAGGAGMDYVFVWIGVARDGGGLYGGAGDDTLVGGGGQDSLLGETGDDLFIVDQEAGVWDWYNGDAGSDTASFERFTLGVSFDLAVRAGWSWAPDARTGGTSYGSWTDGFYGIENVTGSNLVDTLLGDEIGNVLRGLGGDDILNGKEGDDTLEGGAGADQLNGHSGNDTLSYKRSIEAVWVDLTGVPPEGGGAPVPEAFLSDAEGDTFTSIENLSGSDFADTFKGDANTNRLTGLKGDDWFVATTGADTLDGGDGFDTIDYTDGFQSHSETTVVIIDLDPFVLGDEYEEYQTTFTPAVSIVLGSQAAWRTTTGATGVHSLVGIEHAVGSTSNDYLFGSTADETFTGGRGADLFDGGGGSDAYIFNLGDGADTVNESSDGANAVVFGDGVDWSKLAIGWSGSTLHLYLRGTTDQITLNGSMVLWNHKIKSIDMGGAGAIDVNPVNWLVNGTDGAETLAGGSRDWVMAYGGDDIIAGAPGYAWEVNQNLIIGGRGNDAIYTSVGDDQFVYERGDGVDTITDAGGADTLIFGPTVAAEDVIFKVVGRDLYIGARDLSNPTLDASQVSDRVRIVDGGVRVRYEQGGTPSDPNTIEYIIAGGASIDLLKLSIDWTIEESWGGGYYPPVVFDLAGDGLDLISVDRSEIVVQGAPGSPLMRTGWVDGQDGMLAIDRDGDGAITRMSEISFVREKEGAKTDLEGLAGLDSNNDGVLNNKDARWSELKLWRDVNQNGAGYRKEVVNLDAAGIVEIELKLTPTGFDTRNPRDNAVLNSAVFRWSDGRTGTVYDVALARKLAHIGGWITGAPQSEWKQPGDDSELGRAISADGRATVLQSVAVGGVAPPQSLLFARNAAADGVEDLPVVVRKKNTLEDLAADLAKGPVALSAGKVLPIVIDLDGDGLSLIDAARSAIAFDVDQDGWTDKIGWVGASEGIFSLDRDGDGRIGSLAEISFVADKPGARTDLEGLAAFDTDGDLRLTTADAAFGKFMIWRDLNGDGRSNEDELTSLSASGVLSIDLTILSKTADTGDGVANAVLGQSAITMTSGAVRTGFDVALGSLSGLALAAASQTVDADVLARAPDGFDHAGPIMAPWAFDPDVRRAVFGGEERRGQASPFDSIDDSSGIADPATSARHSTPFAGGHGAGDPASQAGAGRRDAGAEEVAAVEDRDAPSLSDDPQLGDAEPRAPQLRDRRWWATGFCEGRAPAARNLSSLMAMLETQSVDEDADAATPRGVDREIPAADPALAGSRDRFIQAMAAFGRDKGADARRPARAGLDEADALVTTPTRWRGDRLKA